MKRITLLSVAAGFIVGIFSWGWGQDFVFKYRSGSVSERNLLSTSRFRSERGRLLQKLSGEQVQEADTLRILSLLIEFQIDDEEGTTGDGRFDLSVPSRPVIDPPPHD
ncbi:MAG: hypothetical protein ABIL68_02520, partial [bacterium]